MTALGGDSFVAAVEFGEETRARVLLTFGNASQPGSPHIGARLARSGRGVLRPAWRRQAEIMDHLDDREILD